MEQNLSILTPRQRQVYLLRQQNLTFPQIGAQLGMSAATAGSTYRAARRRLRDAAILRDAPSEQDMRSVDFPLNRDAAPRPARARAGRYRPIAALRCGTTAFSPHFPAKNLVYLPLS